MLWLYALLVIFKIRVFYIPFLSRILLHLDQFIKDMKACMVVDHLKEIRYHVIAEIVQAAHIKRCKQQINRGG